MKNFYIRISLSITSAILILLIVAYSSYKGYFLTALFLTIIVIGIVWRLIVFCKKIDKDIQLFLQNTTQKDDNLDVEINNYGHPFQLFFKTYQSILTHQKTLSHENFELHQLLITILSKTTAGFIVTPESRSDDVDILFINEAAQNILHIPPVKTWSRILEKAPKIKEVIAKISNGGKVFLSIEEGTEISIEYQLIHSNNQSLRLLTLQDVKSEMDSKETDSWNKLIQVMTHEILNSLTPIQTMSFILEKLARQEVLNEEDKEDMQTASTTIASRSKGLMQFVQDYRKVAALPIPQKIKIKLQPFLNNITQLFQSELTSSHIKLDIICEDDTIVIWADQTQIEQAIINLLSNAIHAVSDQEQPLIQLKTLQTPDSIQIIVSDNGKGIAAENQSQIFIPFFTTRPSGSGIGLSVVRNIMRMHNGSIIAHSEGENKGSTFLLNFPYKY